jgi:parallel beta-helix repeat protein
MYHSELSNIAIRFKDNISVKQLVKKPHRRIAIVAILFLSAHISCYAGKFVHPGIFMTQADMQYMKQQVLAAEQPWKNAYERLLKSVPAKDNIKAVTYVMQGPYGIPDIGGGVLLNDAKLAYNYALLWYITEEQEYADRAIKILNEWAVKLWGFDYNNAKLLGGITGSQFCNAAEILRYTNSGWKQPDVNRFIQMLMTVYYPLIRYYFSEANGNWDGSMINTILSIAVFTDNRQMFNNAIHHFLHAPLNGSLFKYVYPSGQCQESTRDQGHVQMGLGLFAGAARVAYSQGVDLFSIANNRLGLAFEYTAQFLLGKTPHCYGVISSVAKRITDDYEYVYRHYSAMGVDVPFIKQAADTARKKSSINTLTAFRTPGSIPKGILRTLSPSPIAYPAGALQNESQIDSDNAIKVQPGESIQAAIDKAAHENKQIVLTSGIHRLKNTLKIPSGITITGEGVSTILCLDSTNVRDIMINGADDLHDITICNLVIDGSENVNSVVSPHNKNHVDPNMYRSYRSTINRGGIVMRGTDSKQLKNLTFKNVTVRNCTYSGVVISGAQQVVFNACNFDENGARAVPGQKSQHNLLINHCSTVVVKNCRLATSPYGSGVHISESGNVTIASCEIARNGLYGIQVAESCNILVSDNLIEGNDRSGVMAEFLYNGVNKINISNNIIHYNAGYGVESYAARSVVIRNNQYAGNGSDLKSNEKISKETFMVMF